MASIRVLEDNTINMKLAVFLLEKAGHKVLQATDAGDAIRLARERHPNLILMDVHLPDMDGLAATGCDDYITKPISYPEFMKVVGTGLRGREP